MPSRFAFGPYLLDVGRGMLFWQDTPVAVGAKGMALLKALAEARGEVVSKAALMDAAWPNTSVEESNLSVQIAQLRKRLGESADSEKWIATVPRVGYRLFEASQLAAAPPQTAVAAFAGTNGAKPSVAVLPFNNMSSDPEQDYFADGLSEDLITDLSKFSGLLVIARNSSFAYKGKAIDIRQVARELGVRYVIEGSVRRNSDRVRINAQIIDSLDHSHLWADRFDRDLAGIFALQDEIVARIVDAFAGAMPSVGPISARRRTTIEAYDNAVRGRVLSLGSPEEATAGRALLVKAISIDPDFSEAHAWLAMGHIAAWVFLGETAENHRLAALTTAQRAVALDPGNADARANLGYALLFHRRHDEGGAELDLAVRANANHADAWMFSGDLLVMRGFPVDGIDLMRKALRLNPYPPGWYHWLLGYAQYAAGHYRDAVATLRHEATYRTVSKRILAAALAQRGRQDEAEREAREFMLMVPSFSAGAWADTQPFLQQSDLQTFVDGYVKAGLPE